MISILFPVPPQRGNRRGQSRFENYAKKDYYAICDAVIFPSVKNVHVERAWIEATVEVNQFFDWDNAAALFKWPMDWLVSRGILKDDGWDFVRLREPIKQVKVKSKRRNVEIKLFETEDFE